ncbi:hypothetical protein [Tenacibaculum phage JQ]|nr:hypothetical protein [Tenacibaculum phage JQ]
MKKQRWLYKHEAELLGLNPRKNEPGRNKARYKISEEQWQLVQDSKNDQVNNYDVSAWRKDGSIMNIDEYCAAHNLDRGSIKDWRLCTHTKVPTYNITFKENVLIGEESYIYEDVKTILEKDVKETLKLKLKEPKQKKEGVIKWADLHCGAHIENILHVDNYNSKVLKKNLLRSVTECNYLGFEKVHVHIHGDIIESFSGLNHINSWHSMEKGMIGATVIRVVTSILHSALSEINNLGKVKIVAGNHDRTSKANDEDVKGNAANLVSYCLELMGYDVEFDPMVLTHEVDGINYIILHGDKGISKLSTSDIILNYGKQGVYNYICEAHLHSIIEKLTANQIKTFKIVKDDNVLCRREHMASFMPGNFYSASNGWTTNTGYQINWATDRGRPMVLKASF